ncbi:MAG: tail fiber domain-containing protein, partial [Flavobacteriaceae bacterium]|nr:tail fiber domain-containing protein [Flavobacteriaceae bacterium]
FGLSALYGNTTGIENSANGVYALNDNTTGSYNSANGARALINNTTGHHNTASGFGALVGNTTGLYNIANGARSLYLNSTGSRNIAIGYEALYNSSGNDNIALGYQSGYNESGSNKLYIENSNSASPLIYGEFDNDVLGFNGDVAIGHQAPGAPLHVANEGTSGVQNIVAALVSDTSNRPVLQFSETTNVGLAEGMSLEYDGRGASGANRMVFNGVGGNPLFEFRNGGSLTLRNGDLIIRGTATDREIKLDDDAGNSDRALMRQTGTQDIYVGDIDNNGGDTYIRAGGSTELSVIAGTGFVGVNTSAPAFTFEVNGNAAKPGGGSWTNASDRRLKKNIKSFDQGLETILKIEPVTYQYNQLSGFNENTSYVGVIAQELQKVAPNMVTTYTRENEEFLAVDNSSMTYLLINAVKSQQEEIETLKEELSQLKDLIQNFKKE